MLARHVHDLLALSRRQASPDVPRGQRNTDGPKASREARSHGAYPRTGTTRRAPCRGPSPCRSRSRCRCRCHDPSRPRAAGTPRPTSSSSLSSSSSPRARPAALARGAYPFACPSRAPSLSPCPCRRELAAGGSAGGSGRAARREPRRCRWPGCASRLAAPAVGSAGARASGRASGSTLACAQDSNPDRTPEEPPRGRRARSNVCPRVSPREPGAAARTPLGARNAEGMTAVP
jgi:hypothetical protein